MKITDFSIVFVMICIPVFIIIGYHVKDQRNIHFVEMKYTAALRTAVQDAGSVLNVNEKQEWEAGYGSSKFFKAEKDLALAAFYRTMYINLGIEDDTLSQEVLNNYVPAVVVIDYDGYDVYAIDEYTEPDGQTIVKHLWRPKKPYAYSDKEGNIIRFTLDNYTEAYDAEAGQWFRGMQRELKESTFIPLLQDSDLFEQKRRTTIVNDIENDLANVINRHNEFAARNGISYEFTLPVISQEEWNNSIDDIGIMAFIQGIPIGDQRLNNYALGGGRLVKSPMIHAGTDPTTGIRYYYRSGCMISLENVETYSSPKEAAAHGYYEKNCYGGGSP